MKITVEQAQSQLDALIDRSAAGEEVLILRGGLPVAQVIPAPSAPSHSATNGVGHAEVTPSKEPRRPGWGKGIITHIAPDFDEPLDDFKEYMA